MQLRRQTVRVDGVGQQQFVARFVVLQRTDVRLGGEDDACLCAAAVRLDHQAVGVEMVRVLEAARQHQSSRETSLRLRQQFRRTIIFCQTRLCSISIGSTVLGFVAQLVGLQIH